MRRGSLAWIAPLLMPLLVSCGGDAALGTRVWIDWPLDGARLPLEPVAVRSHLSEGGFEWVDLYVNGELARSDPNPAPGERLVEVFQEWTPPSEGEYMFQVWARGERLLAGSRPVRIRIGGEIDVRVCGIAELAPPIPLEPAAEAVVSSPVRFAWSYPETACHPHSYRVDISASADFADIGYGFGTLDHRETSRAWPIPAAGCYFWRVMAYVPDENGPSSPAMRFCIEAAPPTPTPTVTPSPTASPTRLPPTRTPTPSPAPSPPAAPVDLAIAGRVCNAATYSVELAWGDASHNEDGFRVYRGSAVIATLPAGSTSYTDAPPGSGPYIYYVEAFNDLGASARVSAEEEGCLY